LLPDDHQGIVAADGVAGNPLEDPEPEDLQMLERPCVEDGP
jgi:hypothetical protein